MAAGAALLVVAVVLWLRAPDEVGVSNLRLTRQASSDDLREFAAADAGLDSSEVAAPLQDAALDVRARVNEPGATEQGGRVQPEGTAHFTGRAEDDVGFPLVGHTIELHQVSSSGRESGRLEGCAVTNAEGRFRIEAIQPGTKRVVVCGPGGGDIWATRPGPLGFHSRREERELVLGIPEAGLDDFVLKGVDHTGILVTAQVVDDLGRLVQAWDFALVDASGRSGVLDNTEGRLAGIVPVSAEGDFELRRSGIDFQRKLDPLYRANFMPLAVHLTRVADAIDIGTLVVTRMAGLNVVLVDGTDWSPIGNADVIMRCTGGARPPTEVRPEPSDDGVYGPLWSERTFGEYELDVTAPGYQPARRVGVLVAGDNPQRLELVLEHTR